MRDQVMTLVLECCRQFNEEQGQAILDLSQAPDQIILYGGGSDQALDSIGLVTLLSDIEQSLADKLGADLVIADESAFSAVRSPFQSVLSLVTFIEARLEALL